MSQKDKELVSEEQFALKEHSIMGKKKEGQQVNSWSPFSLFTFYYFYLEISQFKKKTGDFMAYTVCISKRVKMASKNTHLAVMDIYKEDRLAEK